MQIIFPRVVVRMAENRDCKMLVKSIITISRIVPMNCTLLCQLSRQQSRKERSSGKKTELAGAREQRQIQLPWMTTNSHAATVTGSAVRGSASTATAGAATLPRTDIYRRKLHCLPRQTDASIS